MIEIALVRMLHVPVVVPGIGGVAWSHELL